MTLYGDGPTITTEFVGGTMAITDIISDGEGYDMDSETTAPNDIYDIQGMMIKRNAPQADIDSLAPGFYIIAGKKVCIR
ncbi:MAG: hypothetical protein NC111_06695 [Bacteroides sp.]|nr:hypothetical protein [Bacteroides sp.]MCM1413788.1 hypothetical protein [Bacteroides sp.]MCM1472193.1 hypothetical protein [Bacteroides sp.]